MKNESFSYETTIILATTGVSERTKTASIELFNILLLTPALFLVNKKDLK